MKRDSDIDGHIPSHRDETKEDCPGVSNDEAMLVFTPRDSVTPKIEIRVNFGIFAGRNVTSAEIDRLAQWLLDDVEAVSILSEERHEIGKEAEASAHQVRIEIAATDIPATDGDSLERLGTKLLERIDYWARTCIAERHAELLGSRNLPRPLTGEPRLLSARARRRG